MEVKFMKDEEFPDHVEERIESQELHCHACGQYVQFRLDMNMNGAHVLNCPNCGHEHCRIVENGRITGDRWGQRNGAHMTIAVAGATTSTASTFTSYNGTQTGQGNYMLYQSWSDTGTGGTGSGWP